jgi:hypothetical protein
MHACVAAGIDDPYKEPEAAEQQNLCPQLLSLTAAAAAAAEGIDDPL